MKMEFVLSAVISFVMLAPVFAADVYRLRNVPNSTTTGSPLIQGDEWTFEGNAGQWTSIRVDTRDDFS